MFTQFEKVCFGIGILAASIGSALSDEWTQEEKLLRFSRQTYHWGQKGEVTPNNGWSAYSMVKTDFGGKDYIVLKQDGRELLASVYAKNGDVPRFKAVVIPGAGLFYFPKTNASCEADAIERLGLYTELALFYLSQSFKDGPTALKIKVSLSVKGEPAQIRFMQGIMNLKSSWNADVTIVPRSAESVHAEIVSKGSSSLTTVDWDAHSQGPVIPDNESLTGWLSCWSGAQSMNADGSATIKYDFPKTDVVISFGDIRKVLKETVLGNSMHK